MPHLGHDPARSSLIMPIALLISLIWAMSATVALITSQFRVLEVTTGPFLIMCGYVFGVQIIKQEKNEPEYFSEEEPTPKRRRRSKSE